MKWFRKGTVSEYSGGRTEKTIVEWVKKKTGPPAVILTTRDQVEEFTESNDVVVVGFMGNGGNTEKETFNTAAYEDDQSEVPYGLASPELAHHYDVTAPAMVVFKKFDEGKVKYVGDWNTIAVSDFILSHSMPLLVPFSEENAPKIFGGVKKTHFLIFCDIDDHPKIRETMESSSKAYRGDMLFITIGSKNTRIIEFFGVDVAEYPTARLVVMGEGNLKKYKYEKTIMKTMDENLEQEEESTTIPYDLESLADVSRFISAFKKGALEPDMKSEPAPEPNDGPVTVVVGTTFSQYVADMDGNQNQDVIIEFYAPWCGHCKRLMPVWEELGVTFKDIPTVRVAKMDATANEHEAVDLSGFPTIMLWPAKSNAITGGIIYEGVRELSGFLEFIEEHAVHKYTLPETSHDEL